MATSKGLNYNIDEEIVISGMSGVFPCSRNVKEFEQNLYNKVNMVNDDESRWIHNNPAVPRYSGKVPQLEHFDATFFGVHQLQADNMDPQNRLLIEEAFKAVMDAGVNPLSLRGSNTGVYVGSCISESENYLYYNLQVPSGFGITGSSKAMFANRISYILGLNGPSLLCDTACSSSMYALDLAYHALRRGEIDAAIVGGSNLCLHPQVTMQFAALGVLSLSGHCCPFDTAASGYTRSEAACCVFLQRKSLAKRIYAHVIHCQTNCDGYKPEGVTYPSSAIQERLLKQLYTQVNFDVNKLGYLEAHSTGTVVGDPEECRAIDNAICSKRRDPLLVGSVKSNCGHSEASSGMCAVVKVIIAMQNNLIPPNINYKNMRAEIDALNKGRLKVVSDPTELVKPYVGVNSFGFGGANAHALLKRCGKEKNIQYDVTISRLVIWSSRTEENLLNFFADLEKRPLDPEYLGLIQSTQAGGIQGMVFRGYGILQSSAPDDNPSYLTQSVVHNSGVKRPLVWVFSGMGSQWVGMGKSLMQLPLFNRSIQDSHNTLKPLGLDLINIITSDDPSTFDNILHSFVGIAAIQIALVDVLRALGLSPDFLIGHSVGELGCAYADDCFTAEQMILAAYYRGKVSLDTEKIKGSMAAIGMGYKDIKPILPEAIAVACHNSSDSCTISGPAADIAKFVAELKSKNVFAREVPCSNIAYHSQYIAQLGPALLKNLKRIIPNPKPRTNKWISSSVPKSQWLSQESKYSSAEYHTNNLLSSVLFEEASLFIPKNALTIEIAPHALLQSILKNAVAEGIHIGLTKRNADDGVFYFLNSLGNLYNHGLELNIDKLYPAVEWPVSRGTPSISHLIDFDHSRAYNVYRYEDHSSGNGIQNFCLKLGERFNEYLSGHEIDGRVLVPATFYLESVWQTFASMKGVMPFDSLAVEFENVTFVRATTLTSSSSTNLLVAIQKGTGSFEITESDGLVATGTVRELTRKSKPAATVANISKNDVSLSKKDFYKELKLRGYHYNNEFQAIESALSNGLYGKVKWTNNWVTFMDCMLQLGIVSLDSRDLQLPTKIRTLAIYPEYHQSVLGTAGVGEIFVDKLRKRISAGGIEIVGLKTNVVQRRKAPGDPVLEKYEFVPHFPAPKLSLVDIARCCIQLLLENQPKLKLEIIELAAEGKDEAFLRTLKQAVEDLPLVTGSYSIFHTTFDSPTEEVDGVAHLNAASDLTNVHASLVVATGNVSSHLDTSTMQNMESNGFLILREKNDISVTHFNPPLGFTPLAYFPAEQETLVLLQKGKNYTIDDNMTILKISYTDEEFQWVKKLQEMCQIFKNVVLVTQNEKINGLMGLVNCLRKEPETNGIRCVIIEDAQAPAFDANTSLYKSQLSLGLALNVYRRGVWGSYRHLQLTQEQTIAPRANSVYGDILRIGDLSTMKWLEGSLKSEEITTNVVYSSLNFRDIMVASGRLPIGILGDNRLDQTCVFGFEFSGIDLKSGDPVMGMVVKSAVASHLGNQDSMTWKVPSKWSLREAATVPVVYGTVYLAFFYTVDIRQGKRVLIHSGSGGIGLAAIRVALAYGLEVFTTVSTTEKKEFLLRKFPALKECNIGNSRDTSFEEMIMERTQGEGVDFVLNSLSEDKLLASVRCLGKRGHFLEIGKFDMANDNNLGLGVFLNELSFHAVLADNLLSRQDKSFVERLKQHISDDIEKGIIEPLPSTVFPAHEMEQAFRYLMSGKHMGKVLLQVRETPESKVTLPIAVSPRVYFPAELVWIVCGGLGGFGLELVDWMILRGARKVVLSSSRGISNDYQKLRISLWKSYSAEIVIATSDISTEDGCRALLKESMKMGHIGGIFNLAVVLKDGIFTNQTRELFQQSFKPKAYATKYLDQLSRKLCPKLQHFVIFSSVSCGRGNAGQTNYGMANSIMERIVEDRVAQKLPGKAIQWGAVGEVGLVAELAAGKIDLEIGGTLQQRISSCLEVLDILLTSPNAIVSSMVVAEKRANAIGQSPVEFALNMLSIRDIRSISMNSTLAELGMDSLMGVEVKQALESEYDIILSTSEVRTLTFAKLIELSENFGKHTDKSEARNNDDYVEYLRLLYSGINLNWKNTATFDHVNDVTVGPPIIVFPGIEGCSGEVWQNLGSNLKSPTYVLQFREKSAAKSVNDMVQYAYKHVSQMLKERNVSSFKIVAYSFGTLVAHLTVQLLEKAGYQGKLIFIDGSIFSMERLINGFKATYSDDEFERIVFVGVLSFIMPDLSSKSILNDLREKQFRSDCLMYIRGLLEKHNFANISFILEYIDMMVMKVTHIRADAFKTSGVMYSSLMLIKPTIPTITNIDEYFGLEPCTRNVIQIQVLEGNHQTILCNEKLAAIINNYFD